MNDRLLELALKKQRLQFRSEALRRQWRAHANELTPILAVTDRIHAGYGWLRNHPEVVVSAGLAIAVARPKLTWRWLMRGTTVWQFWRNGRRWLMLLRTTSPDKRT